MIKIILLFIIFCIILTTLFCICNKTYFTYNKYLTLTFSQNSLIPIEGIELPNETGGLIHNQENYFNQLPILAKALNRVAVLPPPWLCLEKFHNNNKRVNKEDTWDDYFDTKYINNITTTYPFTFNDSGKIISNLTIKYYDITTPLKKFDKNIDIIVLTNFNNKLTGNTTYSFITIPKNINIKVNINYVLSDYLKNFSKYIINKFNLTNYAFIHIRRGDTLYNKIYAPPDGTVKYTEPNYIKRFVTKFINNKNIVISTNEKDDKYKQQLIKLLNNKYIFWEDDFIQEMPYNIKENNYKIFLIMDYLAYKSNKNIITTKLRLGNKFDFSLMKNYF